MLKTIKTNEFLDEKTLQEITDGYWYLKKLVCEELLETSEENVHFQEFQPINYWPVASRELSKRNVGFQWDRVHLEYHDLLNDKWPRLEENPKFVDFLHAIKPRLNLEEYHNFVHETLNKQLSYFTDDHKQLYYYAIYDLNFSFGTHSDGRDIKHKRDPRPENWSDLKREDWEQEDDVRYTRQGLINLDVTDPTDGTVMFEQSFPYSVYLDMGVELGKMPHIWGGKPRIQFVKGDEPYRFGEEIKNFTHKIIDEDEYDEIMEHCIDESIFPIESTYGLSLEQVLTLDNPGTMYTWDCQRFHKVKPFSTVHDPNRRRLTIHFTCVEEL
jgi:hypothetical protein